MADDGILFAKILRQFARSSTAINPAPEDKVSLHQSKFVFQIILILWDSYGCKQQVSHVELNKHADLRLEAGRFGSRTTTSNYKTFRH